MEEDYVEPRMPRATVSLLFKMTLFTLCRINLIG